MTTGQQPDITADEARLIVDAKTAPRVTEQSIKDRIDHTQYLRADLTTICIITVNNGFKVIGTSTPASAANYDQKVGERYAYDNAFKQLWVLEGYLLREKLANATAR